MNWVDYAVIAIILGFGIFGLVNGFLMSVFRLTSFFVSIFLAVKFYPVISGILEKTPLYSGIKASIYKSLALKVPGADSQVKEAAANSIVDNLHLPGFFKGTLLNHIPNPSKLIDTASILDSISAELAKTAINIISLVLIYIAIRIGLTFARFIIKGIARLPLFKQVDKLGGFALGSVEGLLTIYVLFAMLLLFNTAPQFKALFDMMDNSVLAGFFYQHNFIIDWMFPASGFPHT